MIDILKNWFVALSKREQVLVSILASLLLATFAFYGVYRPLSSGIEGAEERYQTAMERQARIESKTRALAKPRQIDKRESSSSAESILSQSAGEEGFAVGRLDAQTGGRAIMVIDSAKTTALFGWLSKLEARGLAVEELQVSSAENSAVRAQITFRSVAAN